MVQTSPYGHSHAHTNVSKNVTSNEEYLHHLELENKTHTSYLSS